MSADIVVLENTQVSFNGQIILQDLNLNVAEDDFLGIIGPNGGGKTTLLKVILGLVKADRGEVSVFGRSPGEARGQIGYMPQMSQFDHAFPVSALDVVLMGRLSHQPVFRRFTSKDRDLAGEALQTVKMSEYRNRQIGRLSVGQRQRVFLARALVSRPKLLLLDEPTASIDPQTKTGIYDLLDELKKQMAIVLVTHDVGVISSHVDNIACLNQRLFYHDTKEISREVLQYVYQCPVDLIAHGVPHRVFKQHLEGPS